MARIIIVWGLWGPYHCRRFEAFRKLGQNEGHEVVLDFPFSGSSVNQWHTESLPSGVVHFDFGRDESRLPVPRIGQFLFLPAKLGTDVALLPSYYHWSLILNAGVRLAGGRVVMMNETHAGTARARGLKAVFKRWVVSRFDAALVGGLPHRRYFASLGIPSEKISLGYDAVDNEYFARRAEEVGSQWSVARGPYTLPAHYFLSLGRFVAKKNLGTLIRAYALFLKSHRRSPISDLQIPHLVMVGSGEEEPRLRALCAELQLPICDHAPLRTPHSALRTPQVHFYGFRQIDENPVFYALADAFILPSLYEEWGLVVNEAMASGLPVVVSETAGCAEDLLETGCPPGASPEDRMRIEQSGLALKVRQNGFLFNPRSAEELSRALLALEGSANLRALMGAESRRIVDKFSCENFARNAMRAVEAALGKGACARPAAAAIK